MWVAVPRGASLNRYALVKGESHISENVLVAQRAYLENAWLGKGANAQENCYIINSRLEGNNVTAHGGKIIHANLGKNVFVGFNSFLRGTADLPLEIRHIHCLAKRQKRQCYWGRGNVPGHEFGGGASQED